MQPRVFPFPKESRVMTEIPFEEAKKMRETNPFDPRNVRDEFKGKTNEEIIEELRDEKSQIVLCLSNEIRDMNLSSCIRSANSFNINHVVMTGRRNYDRRGAVGAQNYIDVRHEPDLIGTIGKYRAAGFKIVALEYDENFEMTEISEYQWDDYTLLIAGEEGRSLPETVLTVVDDIVYIPMMGTVRSLNLASAVSIALYDYEVKQWSRVY